MIETVYNPIKGLTFCPVQGNLAIRFKVPDRACVRFERKNGKLEKAFKYMANPSKGHIGGCRRIDFTDKIE